MRFVFLKILFDRNFSFCLRFLLLANPEIFFAKPKCEPATSQTSFKGGVVKAISLSTDRHTMFAMTSLFAFARDLSITMKWNDGSNLLMSLFSKKRTPFEEFF